jgi:hypothetical protein
MLAVEGRLSLKRWARELEVRVSWEGKSEGEGRGLVGWKEAGMVTGSRGAAGRGLI